MPTNLNKIAILGITGSGKSTVSRRIAEKTGLPLFHMDALFWKSGWTEVPEAEYRKAQEEILKNNPRWIIEGWVNPHLMERIVQADLIIYLDYVGWRAAWRYLVRAIKYRKVARPELPPDCFDTFKLHRFLISLFRGERSEIEEALRMVNAEPKVVRLKSPRKMEQYLKTFNA